MTDDRFKFDTEPEVMDELDELGCNALNSRVFCTMIENRGWKKDLSGLKNWIETKSKLLPVDVEVAVYDKNGQFVENEIHKATKQMLLDIIDDYYVPTREELFRQYGIKEEVTADDEEKETAPEASAENDATTDTKQDPEVTADAAPASAALVHELSIAAPIRINIETSIRFFLFTISTSIFALLTILT